jgi:hypothetical protein
MDLLNFTPFPALLTRFGASADTMGSSLVVRVSYNLEGGRLVPSEQQSWTVSPKPWECEYGPMEADEAFYKGGTDVFVFGHARSPGRRPVTQLAVTVEIGHFRHEVAVIGERAWLPRTKSVVMSAPKPFVEMPLIMANAYGGTAEWDGLKVPFADNPAGKGFILDEEGAPGQRLPNIENPRALITRWDDRPTPVGVGVCPPAFSGRLRAGITFSPRGIMKEIHARLFNAAFPEMVAPDVRPGLPVRVMGVSHDGPVAFALPETPVVFRLSFDQTQLVRKPAIDQVGIEVDKQRVFITYRYPFRYVMYPGQRRQAELLLAQGG